MKKRTPGSHTHILGCFKTLKLIEQYWAFPGIAHVQTLVDIFKRQEYGHLANLMNETLRTLAVDLYPH